MLITETMSLFELAGSMGQITTEDEARAMRDLLVDLHPGEDTSEIDSSDWIRMLTQAVRTAYRAQFERHDYEIGGLNVAMTAGAASRWNSGEMTAHDLRMSIVSIPVPYNDCRQITLRRAMNSRLEPEIASMLHGMPANLIG